MLFVSTWLIFIVSHESLTTKGAAATNTSSSWTRPFYSRGRAAVFPPKLISFLQKKPPFNPS